MGSTDLFTDKSCDRLFSIVLACTLCGDYCRNNCELLDVAKKILLKEMSQ